MAGAAGLAGLPRVSLAVLLHLSHSCVLPDGPAILVTHGHLPEVRASFDKISSAVLCDGEADVCCGAHTPPYYEV